jgi:hypothetical protein
LSAVSIRPHRRLFDELINFFRAPAVYLVSRRLPTAILYFPHPRFDFLAFFTLKIALTNLRSAGQPTANAVSRSMLFSLVYSGVHMSPCFSLSSSLRKKDRAIPGPRSPCAPAQVCMYAILQGFVLIRLHLHQKQRCIERWKWPTSVLRVCNCSGRARHEVRRYMQHSWTSVVTMNKCQLCQR